MTNKAEKHIGFHYLLTEIQQFRSFMIEYIPQKILNNMKDKFTTRNIVRIQDDDSIICGIYSIPFIKCRIAGKTLFDYTNFIFPNYYK